MHTNHQSPFPELLQKLDQPQHVDLDELRRKLLSLSVRWDELAARAELYEGELQRELIAKIDLCGGVPGCPDVDSAAILNGDELLAARRTASLQFNRVFFMAPLSRNAIHKNNDRPNDRTLHHDVALRAQKNL